MPVKIKGDAALKYQIKLVKLFMFLVFSFFITPSFADEISVCFTPGQNCTQQIVNVINNTQKSLLIQAYQFTSAPIAKAVVSAKHRGVNVKIILDKSQYRREKYSSSLFFDHAGIPVWIDYKPNIAHNKIMISDNKIVITGSFNFTKNAQDRNAENLLIITDQNLANKYIQNFDRRLSFSDTLNEYMTLALNKEKKRSNFHMYN